MAEAREEEHQRAPCEASVQTCPHPSPPPGECNVKSVCLCVFLCVRWFRSERMKVGELLAVLVLVVHGAFESQAGEVLEDEVVVLGDAVCFEFYQIGVDGGVHLRHG